MSDSQSTDSSPSEPLPCAQAQIPNHVAIIMDGNGRWAEARHLPRVEGHRVGAKTVRMVVEESRRIGVRYLTLFAFSTENWERPVDEVQALMKLFERYLSSELPRLLTNNVRLRAIGDLARLPEGVQRLLNENQERTASCDGMDLVLAISYGGREELVAAAQKIARRVASGELVAEDVSAKDLQAALYAPDIPDPDLLIRTSNEFRISNFLLWQLAYSEIVVTDVFWPDFSKERYHACIREYASRDRRFGLTAEQMNQRRTASGR